MEFNFRFYVLEIYFLINLFLWFLFAKEIFLFSIGNMTSMILYDIALRIALGTFATKSVYQHG